MNPIDRIEQLRARVAELEQYRARVPSFWAKVLTGDDRCWTFSGMPNDGEPARDQRTFNAIHAPLSEFFDAYVIIGYTAGKHDRLVMRSTPNKVFEDALRGPAEAADVWYDKQ